jgi:hypothetical protein
VYSVRGSELELAEAILGGDKRVIEMRTRIDQTNTKFRRAWRMRRGRRIYTSMLFGLFVKRMRIHGPLLLRASFRHRRILKRIR